MEMRPNGAWGVAIMAAAMAYAQYVLLKLRLKRQKALLALTPLIPLFLYLPSLPASCHLRTMLAIPLLWIAPSKLALLAFDRPFDPLPWISSGFIPFCASTLLPVRIKAAAAAAAAAPSPLPSCHGVLLKVILLVAIMNLYPLFPAMPLPLLYFLYCVHFYLGLELAFFAVAKAVEKLLGVTLCPQFDRPYLAESLADFWGRRWNLTVHNLLKATVYRPMMGVKGGGQPARSAAVAAAFAVSAAIHEVIYVYVSKSRATGEMAAFFLLHGAATIAEAAAMSRYCQLPRRLRHFLTIAFVYVTACFFFMTPLRRAGIDEDAIAEYHRLQSTFLSLVWHPRH